MSLMGELKYFLGLQIRQQDEGIYISQQKYIKNLLTKFNIQDSKPIATPMSSSSYLDKDEIGQNVDKKLFRSMIGSLLYLTASRSDIMFSVCLCARFQSDPKEYHLKVVKQIFRYLKGSSNLELFYPKSTEFFLEAYIDADYDGCKIDKKKALVAHANF